MGRYESGERIHLANIHALLCSTQSYALITALMFPGDDFRWCILYLQYTKTPIDWASGPASGHVKADRLLELWSSQVRQERVARI